MSHAAPIEPTLPESSSSSPERAELENNRRFADLRGVQWRIDLGILPSSSSTVDDFRRVTANSRRSYAALRRRLLINSSISKDESNFRDLVIDNPLSQNPDSMWGRFFHKAELERMVDQDLSRLYPEHGSYFQTTGCQGVLRRVLLLWCIRYPNYGYRQGMHELLAPLLYVLQADLERLSEVRKLYPDYFTDNFDGLSFNDTDISSNPDLEKGEDNFGIQKDEINVNHIDPKILTIISFSDAYGAEGELGIVLSEKFIEHDAYTMFDALMNGDRGAVAMANFFSHSPSPQNGLPPVIEASSALYHLLSIVDLSLYTHLVELGVEPQYFALRWLRVLFGREFALDDLLVIWDEIFALDNNKLRASSENESEVAFRVLNSSRGAFISALAVSMILYLRSSLLATENATSCLQRLLNFPADVDLRKLITKAKSLMDLATDAISSAPEPIHGLGLYEPGKPRVHGHGYGHSRSVSSDVTAAVKRHGLVPESYWEEKWRDMNKEEDRKQVGLSKQVQNRIKGWSEKVKMRLSKVARLPTRRSLVDDLARLKENEKLANGNNNNNNNNDHDINNNDDHENETERSSVASNSSVNGNHPGLGPSPIRSRSPSPSPSTASGPYVSTEDVGSPLPVSDTPEEDLSFKEVKNDETIRKPLSGKFQWLWMFSKTEPEDSLEKSEPTTSYVNGFNQKIAVPSSSTAEETSEPEAADHNNLKNLAQSMLENIEVIESVQNLSTNTMEALKELRKISNILSEM
ncbi:putative Rab-GTPase-TBC domain-containing protein [Helianthus debilis subsp. tardiflorus]